MPPTFPIPQVLPAAERSRGPAMTQRCDPSLLADAKVALDACDEPWASEVVRALSRMPSVRRVLERRRVWSEAAVVFEDLLARGLSTRDAAEQTRLQLLMRGLRPPHANTIRQRLLRRRIEARTGTRPIAAPDGPSAGWSES